MRFMSFAQPRISAPRRRPSAGMATQGGDDAQTRLKEG
jgi:hypothetical protein